MEKNFDSSNEFEILNPGNKNIDNSNQYTHQIVETVHQDSVPYINQNCINIQLTQNQNESSIAAPFQQIEITTVDIIERRENNIQQQLDVKRTAKRRLKFIYLKSCDFISRLITIVCVNFLLDFLY